MISALLLHGWRWAEIKFDCLWMIPFNIQMHKSLMCLTLIGVPVPRCWGSSTSLALLPLPTLTLGCMPLHTPNMGRNLTCWMFIWGRCATSSFSLWVTMWGDGDVCRFHTVRFIIKTRLIFTAIYHFWLSLSFLPHYLANSFTNPFCLFTYQKFEPKLGP